MAKRIVTPPTRVLDESAAFWRGDTARRVMKKRVKEYAEQKRAALMKRRANARTRKQS